ncbi:hypothetical protein LNO81_14665 [Klebsiella variicola subsp. variicola]|nr:hypothetical protein [Klebsiella variicola subsp. variicola]
MFIAFALEGVAMMLWLACREDPLLLVLLSGVVFFGWGRSSLSSRRHSPIRSASEHAATNYGWLYISQGIGSIFGGSLAALLYQYTHGWHVVFSCAIGLDFVTAALALWVLKPWRAPLSASTANCSADRSDGSPVTSLIFAAQQRVQVLIAPLAF